MERAVTIIKSHAAALPQKKKAAAYARVSLGTEHMLHSLAAQVSYYSDYIQKNPEWEYIGVFADFDKTGTKDDRPEFQKMPKECRAGNVDIVITKSISRLAGNTVTLLETVRELKDMGVDIYFEEQNIHTLSGEGELLITILASHAQEESRNVSENIKWRKRRDMREGKTKPVKMYGFEVIDGRLVIKEDEAAVIRRIFDLYLSGKGYTEIANILTSDNILSPTGLDHWDSTGVDRILHNEKVCGNLLHQRTFVTDHISKKQVRNKGELPMYIIEGTHEGIISSEIFKKVKAETERRAAAGGLNSYYGLAFRKLIKCGCCVRKFIHTGNGRKWRRQPVWRCGGHDRRCNPDGCPSKDIPEDILMNVTKDVLGLTEYDGDIVKEQIEEILVPEHHTLVFIFKDGRKETRQWQSKKKGPKKDYDGKRY